MILRSSDKRHWKDKAKWQNCNAVGGRTNGRPTGSVEMAIVLSETVKEGNKELSTHDYNVFLFNLGTS
jgi:hypothetical protein